MIFSSEPPDKWTIIQPEFSDIEIISPSETNLYRLAKTHRHAYQVLGGISPTSIWSCVIMTRLTCVLPCLSRFFIVPCQTHQNFFMCLARPTKVFYACCHTYPTFSKRLEKPTKAIFKSHAKPAMNLFQPSWSHRFRINWLVTSKQHDWFNSRLSSILSWFFCYWFESLCKWWMSQHICEACGQTIPSAKDTQAHQTEIKTVKTIKRTHEL